MRAWELKSAFGLDTMTLGERPDPRPDLRLGPGEVMVRMRAASLNFRDTLVVEGGYGARVNLPLIPVSDGVGEVVAVGEGVTRFHMGDRVCPLFFQRWQGGDARQSKMHDSLGGPLDGVLAEFRVFPEDGVAGAPAHLSDVEAACLPCAALTAWSALTGDQPVRAGETVLVQGTGGVALFALQFAKLMGARVIVTSSSGAKLERARALGADHTINYHETPHWDHPVKDLTGGEGCDHIIELGGADTLGKSIRAARTGGRISVIGVLSGATAAVTLPLVVMRSLALQGVTVGSRDGFEAMARAIAHAGLRPVVDREFPFDEAPDAFRHLKSGAHFGKVCIAI